MVFALAESTGLSVEGVAFGLDCLEKDPSDAELATLVSGVTPSPRVHVILSANVFTAPLRALAVACAASSSVSVRPSRRDPVFARELVRRAPGLRIRLDEAAEVSSVAEGEIHVYGRDETIAAVRASARPGVRVRAHGPGMGLALVSERADLAGAARGLAEDVVAFDQRGCLSPRVALVIGDRSRGERFADLLDARLADLGRAVPRGRLDPDETRDAARYVETMAFAGEVRRGEGHVVGLAVDGALVVPPPGRHVHVAVVAGVEEAGRVLGPVSRFIVAVGCDKAALVASLLVSTRVRISPLGRMQRPPLDGPVDLR